MRRFAVYVLLVATVIGVGIFPTLAQSLPDAGGAADFRTAPILDNGTFQDQIVTGETVWYGVRYTNNSDFRFEPALLDEGGADELTLKTTWWSPSLNPLLSKENSPLAGSGRYGSGDATNIWFVSVALISSGRVGVLHTMQIAVDGAGDPPPASCDADPQCDADDRYSEVQTAVEDAEARLADLPSAIDTGLLAEVSSLQLERSRLQLELAAGNDQSSDEGQTPDPSGKTPVAITAILAALAVGVYTLVVIMLLRRRSAAAPVAQSD